MKRTVTRFIAAIAILGGLSPAFAADMKDKVKMEVGSVGLHPGMDPGLYVCALGHLHIKGTLENLSDVSLGRIKVAGKAFDADGKLLGVASSTTKQAVLAPSQKTEFNLEFLSVTGPKLNEVKRHEVGVVEAPTKN
ncbi:MAG TPA: FxLYD domain-containing protein [Anaerolineales bacterium]|jgi:hypothetical protein